MRITVDYWRHIAAGHSIADGYGGQKTAPEEPGFYTLYELADDHNCHTGWEWEAEK